MHRNRDDLVAAPPDDGHLGSHTLPGDTLTPVHGPGPNPELDRDRQKTDENDDGPWSLIVLMLVLVLVLAAGAAFFPWG